MLLTIISNSHNKYHSDTYCDVTNIHALLRIVDLVKVM